MMYGTPDQVVAQIRRQHERIGGFDHLLMMMQAGYLNHEWTVRNVQSSRAKSIRTSRIFRVGREPQDAGRRRIGAARGSRRVWIWAECR